LRSRSRGGYLSARLLYRAMRILLVNEFMRRPECTVKSNVTRHSWHMASPPRKTSRCCKIRHPEDVCRNIFTFERERERETCIPTHTARYYIALVYHFYANNPLGVFLRMCIDTPSRLVCCTSPINFTQSIFQLSLHAAF